MENHAKTVEKKINEEVFPRAEEAIENAKATGTAYWQQAKVKGQDLLDELESSSQKALDNTADFIRKKPGQALGIAVIAGVILGAVLFRKKK